MSREEWRAVVIDGEEWPYEVSNHGRVRRTYTCSGKWSGRVRKNVINRRGYLSLVLYKNRTPKSVLVHRLVLTAFRGPPPTPKHECNHKDLNKTNNNIENLEWATSKQNTNHAIENGRHCFLHIQGENNPKAKLTRQDVVEIKKLLKNTNMYQKEIAKIFVVSTTTISDIKTNKKWKHINV